MLKWWATGLICGHFGLNPSRPLEPTCKWRHVVTAMSSTWWTIKTNKKFYNSLFYGGGFGKFCFWTQIEGGLDYSKVVIYFFFSPAIAIVQPQILKNWRHIWNFFCGMYCVIAKLSTFVDLDLFKVYKCIINATQSAIWVLSFWLPNYKLLHN